VIILADADGADGIFGPGMNPDHPGSSSAFTTEGNLNAEHAKKRLRTTQRPSKQSWISWPVCASPRGANTSKIGAGTQRFLFSH
jgi:hypothetical protein